MKRHDTTHFARAVAVAGMLALTLAPRLAIAQEKINFSDFVSGVVFSHIYGPQAIAPGSNLTGNIATAYGPSTPYGDYPTGTTSYQGPLLGGSATGPTNELDFTNGLLWTAQLWAVVGSNVPVSYLQPIPQYTTTLRTGPNYASAGFITPLAFTTSNPDHGIPSPGDFDCATCQLRVWYNGGGIITNWRSALKSGVLTGASAVFTVSGLASVNGLPPPLPANLAGLQSFSLYTPFEWTNVPQIIGQPASVTVPQGSNVTFSVSAYGTISYQWQLNGANLADGVRVTGSIQPPFHRARADGRRRQLPGHSQQSVQPERQLPRLPHRDRAAAHTAIGNGRASPAAPSALAGTRPGPSLPNPVHDRLNTTRLDQSWRACDRHQRDGVRHRQPDQLLMFLPPRCAPLKSACPKRCPRPRILPIADLTNNLTYA